MRTDHEANFAQVTNCPGAGFRNPKPSQRVDQETGTGHWHMRHAPKRFVSSGSWAS